MSVVKVVLLEVWKLKILCGKINDGRHPATLYVHCLGSCHEALPRQRRLDSGWVPRCPGNGGRLAGKSRHPCRSWSPAQRTSPGCPKDSMAAAQQAWPPQHRQTGSSKKHVTATTRQGECRSYVFQPQTARSFAKARCPNDVPSSPEIVASHCVRKGFRWELGRGGGRSSWIPYVRAGL